jgi:hypothetical protein
MNALTVHCDDPVALLPIRKNYRPATRFSPMTKAGIHPEVEVFPQSVTGRRAHGDGSFSPEAKIVATWLFACTHF